MRASTLRSLVLAAASALAFPALALADSELADLIQAGRRDEARALLAAGADVNAAQNDGTTPLHWAVYRVDLGLVEDLLARGAEPDAVNRYGSSPLAEAVKVANVGLVGRLLAAGADANAANADGQSALMLAARTGSVPVAELLVEHGADVDARERWREQTALMWAAEGRHAELTQFLIDRGADVEARAAANDWAAQITSEPRAQYRPTGGLTPLLYAARSGCVACAASLLAAGADVDRPTPDGVTPLMLAIDNYEFDVAALLLDRGANPELIDWWGRTALYIAVDMNSYFGRGEHHGPSATSALELIDRLLAAGVEPNTQLNMHRPGRGGNSARFNDDLLTTGATPLLRAAITHDHEAMRALLAHGARVDLPNVMGVTPLMAATGLGVRNSTFGSSRHPEFDTDERIEDRVIASLEILLAAGADIDARVTDIESRTARIARISQMTDRLGQTALHAAARRGWPRVVEFLIGHGATVDVVDAYGASPIDAALGGLAGRGGPTAEQVAEILRNARDTQASSRL